MPLGKDGTKQTQATPMGRGDNHAWRCGAIAALVVLGGVPLLPGAARAQLPSFQLPSFALPAPQIQAPQVQAPQIEAPQIQAPQIQAPQIQAPQVQAPQVQAPQVQAPQIQAPQIQAPQVASPQLSPPQLPPAQLPPTELPPTQFSPYASATPVAATSAENPFVQRDVPAEATADNAVVARDRALAAGQRIAYERMAAAMGLPLNLSDQQIEAMVSSLVIESERITPRGYSARITVNFDRAGTGPRPPQAPPPTSAAVASVEAVARYASFRDYLDLTRRLAAQPAVSRVEVLAISGEAARLRLGLRSQPEAAAADLVQGGLLLGQGAPGEGWRIGLAGGR